MSPESSTNRRTVAVLHVALVLCVGLLLESLVLALAESYHRQAVVAHQRRATQDASVLASELEGRLDASLMVLHALAAEVRIDPDLSGERFALLAEEMVSRPALPVRHVALAPDLVIRHIHPREGNEAAIGFDYRTSPEQFADVERCLREGRLLLTGPVDLVQGGQALVARLPVTLRDGTLWGLLGMVIEVDTLAAAASLVPRVDDRSYALRAGGDAPAHLFGDAETWRRKPVTVPVEVPGDWWTLSTAPADGRWASRGRTWWTIVGLGTLAVTLITGFMAQLLYVQGRLRQALATIGRQARFDSLTELPNRSHFVSQLEGVLHSARRTGRPFALLFVDVDHFKQVNDTLGHHVGDQLIRALSQRVRGSVRSDDLVARLGGDEFVIVLREVGSAVHAERRARAIQTSLEEPVRADEHEVHVSVSIGIALFPEDGRTADDLLRHADLAMYAAKGAGRRTLHFFNAELRKSAESHRRIHDDILVGLAQGQFSVHYQPIVDLETGRVAKAEALLRWFHPERGAISPAEFIPIAETTGVIRNLGALVLRQVAQDHRRLREAGLELSISVNRSPRELTEATAAAEWLAVLAEEGMPPERLVLEITESVLVGETEREQALLRELRGHGIRVAIDDFGTGYSSLNYLRRYPVDLLKIDRSFLESTPEDERQVALLGALLRVARSLGIATVAEGVEEQAQRDLLEALGCRYAQGWLLGRPVPLDALIDQLT